MMALLELISRRIGVDDLSLGAGSETYTDFNGVVRSLHQFNAAHLPIATGERSTDSALAPWYMVRGGTHDDLADSITVMGANDVTLAPDKGSWVLTDNLTVPTNIELFLVKGVVITIPDTKTLTINGPFVAGLHKVFNCLGTGKVVFGAGAVEADYPQWWGGVPDGSDHATEINAAAIAITPGLVRLTGGTWGVGSKLVAWASMEGFSESTIMQMLAGFADTMMVDFYTTDPAQAALSFRNIIWDGNRAAGISGIKGWSSSVDNGRGNATHLVEDCEFRNFAGAYAVYCNNTGMASTLPGFTAGTEFRRCKWQNCEGLVYSGLNSDDVLFSVCRFHVDSATSTMEPMYFTGLNNKWQTCYLYINANVYSPAGYVYAPVRIATQSFSVDGCFIECTDDSINLTHVFRIGDSRLASASFRNIQTNLAGDSSGLAPAGMIALIYAQVGADTTNNYPVIEVQHVRDNRDNDTPPVVPTWKVLDLTVGTAVNTDYLTFIFSGIDYYPPPFFQWRAGTHQTRETLVLRGVYRGTNYHHGYQQDLGSTTPFSQHLANGQKGVYTTQQFTEDKAGALMAGPARIETTDTMTLPHNGLWEVTVSCDVNVAANKIARKYLIYWYEGGGASVIRDATALTVAKSTPGAVTFSDLVITGPDINGLLTATLTYSAPLTVLPVDFFWKVRRDSNWLEACD